MANNYIREAVVGSDDGIWGAYVLGQSRNSLQTMTCRLFLDSNSLKLGTGRIGIDNDTNRGTCVIDTETTISTSGVSSGIWAVVEVAVSGTTVTLSATNISGATNQDTIPTEFSGAYDSDKGGFYITSTKRAIGLVYKDATAALIGVAWDRGNGRNSYYGTVYNNSALSVLNWTFDYEQGTSEILKKANRAYTLDGNLGIGNTAVSILRVYENTTGTSTASGLTVEQDGTGDAIAHFLLTGGQRWVVGIDNSDSDNFKISSSADLNSDARLTLTTTGRCGIGTISPDGTLHVMTASAGTVSAIADADDLTLENSGNVGVSFLCPDANTSTINFETPSAFSGASITWLYGTAGATKLMSLGSQVSGGSVRFVSGLGVESFTITSSQSMAFAPTEFSIAANTSDASDTKIIKIAGGGEATDSRGAYCSAHGNETSTAGGRLLLSAGNVATGTLYLRTGGAFRMQINSDGRCGFGEGSPDTDIGGITLNHGSADGYAITIKNSDVAHPFTSFAEADTYLAVFKFSATAGGVQISTFSDADATALHLAGFVGHATPTSSAIRLTAYASSGTTVANIPDSGIIASFYNNASTRLKIYGSGDVLSLSGYYGTDSLLSPTIVDTAYTDEDGVDGKLKITTKVIAFEWDMDSVAALSFEHDVSVDSIISVNVWVRNDDGTYKWNLDTAGSVYVSATEIIIDRTSSGFFDNSSFDDETIIRGYIYITYITS